MGRVGVSRWEDVFGENIERYWLRLRAAGLEAVDLEGPAANLDSCDALVLTGGYDVDPARYSEERHAKVQEFDPNRDEFELDLLDAALKRDLPVLAVCRGHQLLNVALGGSLLQHVRGHSADYRSKGYPSRVHTVALGESRARTAYGGGASAIVNSRHHQAVTPDRLAPGLRPVGLTEDGLVEAVESERHSWVVGVQWHPERLEPQIEGFEAGSARLFSLFAAAIKGNGR